MVMDRVGFRGSNIPGIEVPAVIVAHPAGGMTEQTASTEKHLHIVKAIQPHGSG